MSILSQSSGKGGNTRGRMYCWMSLAVVRSLFSVSNWSCSFCVSWTKRIWSMAFSMVRLRSSMSMGFVAKSKAPLFIAWRMFCMSPYALTMITRSAGLRISFTLVNSVNPSISGMLMSDSMISMSGLLYRMESASKPLRAKKNSYSPLRILRLKYCLINASKGASSSTLNIFVTAISLIFSFTFHYFTFSSSNLFTFFTTVSMFSPSVYS